MMTDDISDDERDDERDDEYDDESDDESDDENYDESGDESFFFAAGALHLLIKLSRNFIVTGVEPFTVWLVRFPNPLAFGSGLGERTPKKKVF